MSKEPEERPETTYLEMVEQEAKENLVRAVALRILLEMIVPKGGQMPLKKSSSKKAVSKNISEMVRSGYPQKQAVAASLENQRRMKKKGK